MCMHHQRATHPRIRICCPAQFSRGHPRVHHGLCRGNRTDTERERQWLAWAPQKKLFSVSFSRSKLHSGPSDRLTPSSMNLKETNPPQRFIRLCSTPVKTRDTKSCGMALEGTSESFCHAVKRWALCYVLVAQTALSVFVLCARFCSGMQPFFEGWEKKIGFILVC